MSEFRIGHGYDVHRTAPGRALVLGGVVIPCSFGLLGHSDADVLLHAVCDAVLGALALGDIGRHFPDDDDRYLGADSSLLLADVYGLMTQHGYIIGNVDCTIIAQSPRLSVYIEQMRENIAGVLNTSKQRVNVKATTEEQLGFTGAGEGISAHAVVIITKQT